MNHWIPKKLTCLGYGVAMGILTTIAIAAPTPVVTGPLILAPSPPTPTNAPPYAMLIMDNSLTMVHESTDSDLPDAIRGIGYLFPFNASSAPLTNKVSGFADVLYTQQMRNARYNTLYYNPDVDYNPWRNPDGTRYPAAVPSCAKSNALVTFTGADAVFNCVNLTKESTVKDNWCTTPTDCTVGFQTFWPATYYTYTANGDLKRVEIRPNIGNYTSSTGIRRSYEQEIQNFANWYQYYRSRILNAKASIGEVLFNTFPPNTNSHPPVAFGYTNIHAHRTGNHQTPLVPVTLFDANSKTAFYNALYNEQPLLRTPLLNAVWATGMYFKQLPDQLTCQRYYELVISDGIWSDRWDVTSQSDDQDLYYYRSDINALGPLASTTFSAPINGTPAFAYKPDMPYGYNVRVGSPTGPLHQMEAASLADVTLHWWATDLKPAVDNSVPALSTDPATWQHIVTHILSFGTQLNTSSFPASWPDVWAMTEDPMPPPSTNTPTAKINKINCITNRGVIYLANPGACAGSDQELMGNSLRNYDLWHAAVVSRGQFFNPTTVEAFADNFATVLKQIQIQTGSATQTSVNNETWLSGNNVIYQTTYTNGNWTGDLVAYKLGTDGVPLSTPLWRASDNLNGVNPTARRILTMSGKKSGSDATAGKDAKQVAFEWDNLSTVQKEDLMGSKRFEDEDGIKLIRYLRGENINEPGFRLRSSMLGDIIRSNPVYVPPPPFQYGDSSYVEFATAHQSRPPMIYVGANDGMLHAFNADGVEVFAYIPSRLLNKVGALSKADYTHQYYVDGASVVGDVQFADGSWHTVLVGSLGQGGPGLFALDISDPTQFATSQKIALWEFDDDNDRDLGYTFSRPSLVKLSNGRWAAIFGNGYNNRDSNKKKASTTGEAVLYIIDIETGALIKEISTDAGSRDVPNGLASVAVVSNNTIRSVVGTADFVYAGDLHGNLWKFTLQGTPNTWGVSSNSSGRVPLFRASYDSDVEQPITVQPEVGVNTAKGGRMVYFGTGKLLEPNDVTDTVSNNTFYGVWDDGTTLDIKPSDLQQQTILHEANNQRVTSYNDLVWRTATTPGKMGWYMDLRVDNNSRGERVIQPARLTQGRILFVTYMTSNLNTPCSPSLGDGWLMEVDALTGRRTDIPVFNLDNNSEVNDSDLVEWQNHKVAVSGIKSLVGAPSLPSVITMGGVNRLIFSGSNGELQTVIEGRTQAEGGRQSWRQLM
jgi:type IV pilus assembly protein PilY1